MKLRVLLLGLIVVLAGCSLMGGRKSSDGPETFKGDREEIRSVSADTSERDEPRRAPLKPSSVEENRTLGNDPRRAGEARGSGEPVRTATVATARGSQDPGVLMAPMSGRVGIMSLLGNELQHVHAGTISSSEKSYNVQYDFNGYVVEELRKSMLAHTPYQPVMVNSTGALRKAADSWQKSWNGKSFDATFQREFDGIIKQNRLAMLIVISYDKVSDGQLIGGTKLSGSGLYTRSFIGAPKAAVFSTLQFYRLVGEPARLVQPVSAPGDRNIGDLPNVKLPEDLDDLPPRYLVPVYEPLRQIVQNKVHGLVSLPRKLGN